MSDSPNDGRADGQPPLPPDPDPEYETDDEEMRQLLKEVKAVIRILEQDRARFIAEGVDVDGRIASLRAGMKTFIEADMAKQEADEQLLQSTADLADAERAVFQFLAPLVEEKHAEKPFDPVLQEMKEQVDEWRKQMPKED